MSSAEVVILKIMGNLALRANGAKLAPAQALEGVSCAKRLARPFPLCVPERGSRCAS
jgi:hypothetical protein